MTMTEPTKTATSFTLDLTEWFPRHLNAIVPFASTDEARAILCAIRFERNDEGYLRLVATDSYKLGQLDTCTPVDAFEPFSLRAKDLVDAVKAMGKKAVMFVLNVDGVKRHATMTNGVDSKVLVQEWAEFPNYRQLVPADVSVGNPMVEQVAFSPHHLGLVCKAIQALDPKGAQPIRFVGGESALKPHKMRAVVTDVGTLTVILMPVRIPD